MEAKSAVAEEPYLVVHALSESVRYSFAEQREDSVEMLSDRLAQPDEWLEP